MCRAEILREAAPERLVPSDVGDIRRYQDLGVDHLGVGLLTDDLSESLDRIEGFMTTVAPLVQ